MDHLAERIVVEAVATAVTADRNIRLLQRG